MRTRLGHALAVDGRPLNEHRVTLDTVDVRGHEALVLRQTAADPYTVVWRERGGVVSVTDADTISREMAEGELLPVDDLVAFARSLR